MPFPESLKLEAKRLANFRCVVCHNVWVEVHHLTPQKEGGPDTLDNAAPLCGSCHSQFGGNPDLRKQMREMRDWWWESCARAGGSKADAGLALNIDKLHSQVEQGQRRQEEVLGELKALLTTHFGVAQERINASGSLAGVLSVSSSMSTGVLSVTTGPSR